MPVVNKPYGRLNILMEGLRTYSYRRHYVDCDELVICSLDLGWISVDTNDKRMAQILAEQYPRQRSFSSIN